MCVRAWSWLASCWQSGEEWQRRKLFTGYDCLNLYPSCWVCYSNTEIDTMGVSGNESFIYMNVLKFDRINTHDNIKAFQYKWDILNWKTEFCHDLTKTIWSCLLLCLILIMPKFNWSLFCVVSKGKWTDTC